MPTINLYSIADVNDSSNDPTSNFGSSSYLTAGELNSGASRYRETFINFNWSLIPGNSNIISASLFMYLTANYANNNTTFYVYSLNNSWGEYTLNYNNKPGRVEAIGSCYLLYNESVGWKEFILNPAKIKEILTGNQYGVSVYSNVTDAGHNFMSRENTNDPYLHVEYAPASGNPVAITPYLMI